MSDFTFTFTEVDDKTNEVLAAANNLHPEKPMILQSKSLVPYFKACGMTDEAIVPSGLQDYTSAILDIFNVPHTLDNVKLILDREDVKTTLKSAIAAATKQYAVQNEQEIEAENDMPDMSKIQGISPDVMKDLIKKAKEEEVKKEAMDFSNTLFTEVKQNTNYTELGATQEETKADDDEPQALPDPDEKKESTINNNIIFCPRCGWDLAIPYKRVELQEEDKIQFVYSIMHRMPFKKTYGLFQNQLKVTFRSKTVQDSEAVLEQLRQSDDKKKFVNISHMQYYANLYELVLLLDSIDGPAVTPMQKIKPSFESYQKEGKSLHEYMEDICKDYIGTEILFQLISEHFKTFQETYNTLVDEAIKENF